MSENQSFQSLPEDKQIFQSAQIPPRISFFRKIWMAIWPLLAYFGIQIVVCIPFVIVGLVSAFNDMDVLSMDAADIARLVEDLTSWILSGTLTLTSICNIVSLIVFIPVYIALRKKRETPTPLKNTGIGIFGLVFLSGVVFLVLIECVLSFLPSNAGGYESLLQDIFSERTFISFLTICIISPITEEVLFRGLCMNNMLRYSRPWLAISIPALMFGIVHMNIVQGSYAFVLGVFLGWIYYRTHTMAIPVFFHVVFNTTSYFGSMLPLDIEVPVFLPLAFSAIAAAAIIPVIHRHTVRFQPGRGNRPDVLNP